MTNSKKLNVVAGGTTVAALLSLFFSLHSTPPAVDFRPHEALGEVLAAEASRLLAPGARLIVLARDPQPYQVPASAAQVDSFARAVRKSGHSITAIRTFKLDPLRLVAVPSGDFFALLRNGREGDVIVSFLGPPVLDEGQLAKLGGKRSHILAVCSGAVPAQVDLKKLFEQKLLTAAVVSRYDAPTRAVSGSKQNSFEQMFKIITSANVSELLNPVTALNRF